MTLRQTEIVCRVEVPQRWRLALLEFSDELSGFGGAFAQFLKRTVKRVAVGCAFRLLADAKRQTIHSFREAFGEINQNY